MMNTQELNLIGDRIDNVRRVIAKVDKGTWAHNYWTLQLTLLIRKMKTDA